MGIELPVICLMEITIVPLKLAVGVMMRLPVVVALGPKVPVAEI